MRVAIIGAGPAGMTTALQLSREGVSVELFEAGPRVGGMSATIELWGQRVDLGPHRFFSTDDRVNRFWFGVVGDRYTWVDRLTRIHYRGRFFDYPLTPANAAWNLGIREATACLVSYLRASRYLRAPGASSSPRSPESPGSAGAFGRGRSLDPREASFESWVVSRFGRRLFELFFRPYSEKLWGISCDQLSADFAAQRIRDLSLWKALLSVCSRGQQDRHRTLADRFAYPLDGTGSVYDAMADEVVAGGGEIRLREPVRRVVCRDGRATGIELVSGETRSFDHVVSTMPLTHLVEGLPEIPGAVRHAVGELRFRNTMLVYLHVASESLFPDQWLYLHDPGLAAGRVTNFRNWSPSLYGESGTSILAVERWCDESDASWTADDAGLVRHAADELRGIGLLQDEPVLDGHVIRLPRCYPVYRIGYREHVRTIARHLDGIRGLSVIGRYGAFKYNNQDHGILMGLLAAENLTQGAGHDLWEVNSDDMGYQEADAVEGETAAASCGRPSDHGASGRSTRIASSSFRDSSTSPSSIAIRFARYIHRSASSSRSSSR